MKIAILIILSSLICLACSNSNSSKPKVINQIDHITDQEGFLDIPFTIVAQTNQNGYLSNTIQATNNSDTLELIISLKEDIPAGIVNGEPKNMFVQDGIKFESTGSRSNKLFNALAAKYGLSQTGLQLKESQIFTCANLTQRPVDYKRGTPKFKIFLEDDTEAAELYVNFDFKNSIISLNEKDPEYRSSLINLMKK